MQKAHAQFASTASLLEADRIYISVGTRAHVPDMPGIKEVPYLTNAGMMEVNFLPEHSDPI